MIVHFRRDSLFGKIVVIVDEHSVIVLNVMVEEQDLRVVDKRYEMVLYRYHVVVVKYKDIEQEIETIDLELNEKKVTVYFCQKRNDGKIIFRNCHKSRSV